MSTFNPTLPNTSFIGNNDFTWWLGTVENADDRDAKLGRVKVNILGYHKPREVPSNLPWAIVAAPTSAAMANGVGHAGNQLKAGSFVVGFFLDYPDCQQPVVLGSLLSKITPVFEKDSQKSKDYPRSYNNTINNLNASDRGQSAEPLANTDGDGPISDSVAAAAAAHSVANPSGRVQEIPIADGKNGGNKTLDANLAHGINNISQMLQQIKLIKKDTSTTLKREIDKEEQTIPVESTEGFPTRGVLDIDGELIGYNNLSEGKFVLAKRGFGKTNLNKHEIGAEVKLIRKSEYLNEKPNEGDSEGDYFGSLTDTIVDVKGTIDSNLKFIKNSLYWLVNQIKSYLIGQVTKILNSIGVSAISPIPMSGKVLTDAIMYIINEIACQLDDTLIDSLFSVIEDAIDELLSAALGLIDSIQCLFDAVFKSIFSILDIAQDIISTVNDIASSFSSKADIGSIEDLSSFNVTSVLDFIFGLLGIGCPRDIDDPYDLKFSSCPIASVSCGSGLETIAFTGSGIPGRWNPEYSKIMGTFSESGTMVVMDDTPYNSRLVIEHGPSKSGIHIYDNGDVRVTNSQRKTEVVVKDHEVIIHGNAVTVVDGDYNLKVGGNYHLEVLGQYNLLVNKESTFTFAGEHSSLFKMNGKLESNNGLSLVASKIGIAASGQYELQSPIVTSWTTEQNHFALGSYNITCLHFNKFIGLNSSKIVGGNNFSGRVGLNYEQGIGISNKFQSGIESEWWGGKHDQIGMGIWTENKLSVDQQSTIGVTAFTKAAASVENITGATFKSVTGLLSDSSQGLNLSNSSAIAFINAPIVSIN